MKSLMIDDDKSFRMFIQQVLSKWGVCHTA